MPSMSLLQNFRNKKLYRCFLAFMIFLATATAGSIGNAQAQSAEVTIAADKILVREGQQATFTLTRTGSATAALTVTVSVSQTGDFIKTADSYQPPTEVTFQGTDTTATLEVETDNDAVDEDNGSVTVTLQTGTGYTLGAAATQSATVVVADNDQPTITVSLEAPTEVYEDVGTYTITVVATTVGDRAPTSTWSLQIWLAADTAQEVTAGDGSGDFNRFTKSVEFAPEDFVLDGSRYVARKEQTITIVDDGLVEEDETFGVLMTLHSSKVGRFVTLNPGHPDKHVITIRDDAPAPIQTPLQLPRATTTPPDAPRSLTATAEDGQVVLTWQAPANNGGSAILRYEYRLKAEDGAFGEWTAVPDSTTGGANAVRYTVMGLDNGTVYIVEARAVTSVGEGRVARVTVTPATPPDAPRSLTATAEDGQVVLTWQAPANNGGSAILRYEYRLKAEDGAFGEWTAVPDSATGGANAVRYTVMGLDNGTVYIVEARAVTSVGEGRVARVTVTPATPPDAPGSLAATPDDEEVVLMWQAPADNGGSAILRYEYRLQAGAGTFGEWTAIPDSAAGGANAVRYRVTGLTNGTAYIVEVRAVNAAGASAAVRVTVTPRSPAIERFSRLNEEILALQALSLSDQTSRALTQRLATLTPGQPERAQYHLGGQHSLARTLLTTMGTDSGPGLPGPRVDLKDLLGSSSFVLPLRLRDTGLGLDRMTLWGQGRYTRLARAHDANLDWDGDTLSAQVGADVHVRPDLLFGLAVTWADSGVDYQDRSRPGSAVGGTHDNWLVNVQPYVGWRSEIGLGLWATVGQGWGELTIADEQTGRQESKVRVETAAWGLRGPLLSQTGVLGPEATTLTLRSDAAWTRVDVIGNQEDLAGRTVSAGRVRLLLEGQHTHVTPTGERLEPFVELGVRFDVGEGLTGKGVEVGGGLRYAVPRLGLTLEGRGRGMVGHRGYTEWGASGLVRVDPGVSGEGLAVHLAPTYGPAASRVQQVWTQSPGQPFGEPATGVGQPPQAGVDAEVGYGLANVAGARVFTPYGAVTLGQGGGAQYRLGGRWTGVTGLMLSVEGVRQEPVGQQPLNQGLRLRATWGF